MVRVQGIVAFLGLASRILCSPVSEPNEPDPSLAVSVQLAGRTFINKVVILAPEIICSYSYVF